MCLQVDSRLAEAATRLEKGQDVFQQVQLMLQVSVPSIMTRQQALPAYKLKGALQASPSHS
jgi:hypothetical protein